MTTLYDHQGNPLEFRSRPSPGRAGAVPLERRPVTMAGEFSNPEAIKNAWNSAARGDIRNLMRLAEEIEHDLRIAGLLRQRRLAVARLPWRVEPWDEEDEQAQEIADAVTAMLKGLNLRRAISHLQDAVVRPLAVLEIIWQNRGEKTDVVALLPRLGTEFTFDFKESGEQLRLITDPAQPKGQPIEAVKFVVRFSTELSARILSRGGLVKGLAGRWMIKIHEWNSALKFGDIYGVPFRIGKYQIGEIDENISKLKQAVAALGVDAGAVIPAEMEIQIIESAKNSGRDVFSLFLEMNDREIAIGILGQTLTSAGSDLGKGTLALGEVHDEVRHELVESDAVEIADVLTQQLIVPYVRFNFGEQENYPQLVIDTEPKENLGAALDIDRVLVTLGVPLSEAYFYNKYSRPEPIKGEKKVVPPAPLMTPFELAKNQTPHNPPVNGGRPERPFGHPLEQRGE